MAVPVLELWLLVTIPIASQGYCVASLTRTLVSVAGQPWHASVGFSSEPLPVCNSDLFIPSVNVGTGTATFCFCFALLGS